MSLAMITVCIATYNGQKYIKEQINSILNQLGTEDEIIVSDDSSVDGTIDIIEQLNDKRIKIFRNQTFHSPIYNFENAIKSAKGDYIFLSDQDDIWLENKVALIVEQLEKGNLLVFSNASIIDATGDIICSNFFKSRPHLGVLRNLIANNFFGATMAFKKELINLSVPFPMHLPMHDQWLGLIASYYGDVCYIDRPLILYRRHDSNASFCSEKSRNGFLKKISFRLNIIRAFLIRITNNYFNLP